MALSLLFKFLLHLGLLLAILGSSNAQLKVGFYKKTCPKVEDIVKRTTASFLSKAPSLAAPLLRMHFHDCFVRGCDGSVLINSTAKNQAEKSAAPNLSLRGFQVIDAVKAAVEKACPGVVSCADIVALVARDSVHMMSGPHWDVPTGRRDGRISISNEALTNLPPPFANITSLKNFFHKKGLSVKDMVVLSGGHTLGIGHCTSFSNRIYNFTGKSDTDPTLDPNYIPKLRAKCKPGDTVSFVEMDPGSSKIFDIDYYRVVAKRRGLFQSDAALLDDNETKTYIGLQINAKNPSFFDDFKASMVKMGKISVLTGTDGEIRKNCAVINR